MVASGAVDIVIHADGGERVLARHGAGRFLGELNMLTGLRVFVSARVAEAGEVVVVPVADLRRVLATHPGLGDTILAAFMARRTALLTDAAAAIRVVGSRYSADSQRVREFLWRLHPRPDGRPQPGAQRGHRPR